MKFTLTENLPNLTKGIINKISAEYKYDVEMNGGKPTFDISGYIVITREMKNENRITEIRDYIPLNFHFPKHRLVKKGVDVSLRLDEFRFELEGDSTVFVGELELTNVTDPPPTYANTKEDTPEFILSFNEEE